MSKTIAVDRDGNIFEVDEPVCLKEMKEVAFRHGPHEAASAALTLLVLVACAQSETLPEAIDKLRRSVELMEHGARTCFGPIYDQRQKAE